MQAYREDFYNRTKRATLHSAEEIVPLVIGLIEPKSVIDVGCAAGTWLSVFKRSGVVDIFGVDTGYTKAEMLEVPQESIRAVDLEEPFRLARTFDLATSLEVAEHLPGESAVGFVESLIQLAPVILFSAAIPFQGGTNHLNEQWPEYWAKLFESHGYIAIDCLRKRLWNNPRVAWWYAQNTILYVRRDCLDNYPQLKAAAENIAAPPALIHPTRYMATADLSATPFRRLVRALPTAFVNGARRTFNRRPIQW